MTGDYYNSRRYHSFFEGYTEKTVVEDGKQKIIRVYTGDYYRPALTCGQRKLRKFLNCALYALTACLYVYCATRQSNLNLSAVVAICQGFTILALLWLLVSVVDYATAKDKMTIRVYRAASGRLIALSLATAILFGLMSLSYLILAFQLGSWSEFIKLFPFSTISGVSVFTIYYMEKNTDYDLILSTVAPIKDGNEIKY